MKNGFARVKGGNRGSRRSALLWVVALVAVGCDPQGCDPGGGSGGNAGTSGSNTGGTSSAGGTGGTATGGTATGGTGGVASVCGDGVVQGAEECDWNHPLCVGCAWQPGNDHPCISPRVLVLTYHPPGSDPTYRDPDRLSACLLRDFRKASSFHGYSDPSAQPYVRFRIVDSIVVPAANPMLTPDKADYGAIYADNDICAKVDAGAIDEVWMWGGPGAGYPERVMTGPNFDFTDGTGALTCTRQLTTMGFNYGIPSNDDLFLRSQAMHSWAHHIEDYLVWFFEQTLDKGATNGGWWEQFDGQGHRYKDPSPPLETMNTRCGNVHFPPNTTVGYEYSASASVQSSCEDWTLSGGTTKAINSSSWGCPTPDCVQCCQHEYLSWWMQNLPNAGHPNSNWWRFLFHSDMPACDAVTETIPPDCTSLTDLGGSSYLLCTGARTWEDAKDMCRAIGDAWDLVAVGGAAENAHLTAAMSSAGVTQVWTGLNDRTREANDVDADFEWTQCETTGYTNFDSQEPNGGTNESCVEIDWNRTGMDGLHGHWNDLPCAFTHAAICEKTPL